MVAMPVVIYDSHRVLNWICAHIFRSGGNYNHKGCRKIHFRFVGKFKFCERASGDCIGKISRPIFQTLRLDTVAKLASLKRFLERKKEKRNYVELEDIMLL